MIEVAGICVTLGGQRVLEDCSLRLGPGERAALTGPSGCGKTTLLRCVAGLVRPEAGSVRVRGRISVVFQEPRLFPWMTAAQNIAAVLPKAEAPAALDWLARSGLAGDADKYPAALSGGMRQRLSICRALAYGGEVLLLDEPFKGMDPPLRREMLELIDREWAGRTLLLVSHEARDLALAGSVYRYRARRFVKSAEPPQTGRQGDTV